MENIVKLISVSLTNFKNVEQGTISFSLKNSEDILRSTNMLALFGPNGSGKSTMLTSIKVLKTLLSGQSLSLEDSKLIQGCKESATLAFSFIITIEAREYLVFYSATLEVVDKSFIVSQETLSYKGENIAKSIILETSKDYVNPIAPKHRLKELCKNDKQKLIDLSYIRKTALLNRTSSIFGSSALSFFNATLDKVIYKAIINTLHDYGEHKVFVLDKANSEIYLNFFWDYQIKKGGINTFSPTELKEMVSQVSRIIKAFIPGLSLRVNENDPSNVFIETVRNNIAIPLSYESEGIKKLVSLISALKTMYNDSSVLLAIDEFDAGIFAYLVGEILTVIRQEAKGQLIFTTHNLRVLELIDKDCIYFTTTNPLNRYIKFTNIKGNNNLRDVYLRTIELGGQKEEVYADTSVFDISKAFRDSRK